MFWETKLAELQKLAPIKFVENAITGEWSATIGAILDPLGARESATGATKAAALCNLWSKIINGGEPFEIVTPLGHRFVRWNACWQDVDLPKQENPDAVVVEETADGTFDPAD